MALLSACGGAQPQSPTTSGDIPVSAPANTSGQSAPHSSSFTVSDVLARHPNCDSVGKALGSALEGMKLDSTAATAEADGIACSWIPASPGGNPATAVQVAIDPNGGAQDVTTPDDLKIIKAQQISDSSVESRGGIAYVVAGQGDLKIDVTTVDVPGITASITHGIVGAAPTLTGAAAVTVLKELLGI
jgi:hypothetical protein